MKTTGTRVITNFALFQAGWFACVLGAARGTPWWGTAAVAAVVAWHLHTAERTRDELQLMMWAVLVGALWDSTLVLLGWVTYPSGTLIEGAAPYWILALWALFATTLNVSLRWLKGRYALAAVLGAVGGPLSFWGGVRMGAVQFVNPQAAVAALALGWAVITPLLVRLAQRHDGMQVLREQTAS